MRRELAVSVRHLPDILFALHTVGKEEDPEAEAGEFESDVKALRIDELGLGYVIY